MATALCPGSFDPVTLGHLDIIERTARHFDDVIVAVIRNPQKTQSLFSLEERQEMLQGGHRAPRRTSASSSSRASSSTSPRTTAQNAIVKGLRAVSDFDYELQMAQMNQRSRASTPSSSRPARSTRSCRRASCAKSRASAATCRAWCRRPSTTACSRCSTATARKDVMRVRGRARQGPDTAAAAAAAPGAARERAQHAAVGIGDGQPEEFGELLQDAIDGLPEELRQARWLLKEREEVLERARPRGRPDHRGRPGAGRADGRAAPRSCARRAGPREEIVEHADRQAAAIRHEAEDYVDRKLAAFEVVLDRTMQQVQKGRERLQVHIARPRPLEADDDDEPAPSSTRTRPEPDRARPGRLAGTRGYGR